LEKFHIFSLLTGRKELASIALPMTPYLHDKYIPSTITSKGQVTIPAEVRRYLGVNTNDKIAFVITSQGNVLLAPPRYRSIADLAGAAGKLPQPLTDQDIKSIVAEERAAAAAKES
jgi:antitoxin PrlF